MTKDIWRREDINMGEDRQTPPCEPMGPVQRRIEAEACERQFADKLLESVAQWKAAGSPRKR